MSPVASIEPRSETGLSRVVALAEQVEAAVAAGPQGLTEAPRLRVQCLQAIADFSPARPGIDGLAPPARLAEAVLRAGWVDQPAGAEAVAGADAAAGQGPQGLLAAFLIAPAWQLACLPTFAATPRGLWPALAAATFRIPIAFTAAGQIDRVIALQVRATRELAQLVEANPGAAAVRSALEAFEGAGTAAGLVAGPALRRELRSARGKIRQLRVLGRRGPEALAPIPRDGRPLEIGVVLSSLADDRLSRELISRCELLDSERFRVTVFILGERDQAFEQALAGTDLGVRPLEGPHAARVDALRAAMLDVAICGTRVDDPKDAVADLVVQRIAPLQVIVDEAGGTSGLTAADAVFAPEAEAPACSERVLALLTDGWRPVSRAGRGGAGRSWSKAGLGWPSEAVVFSSCAPFACLTPEWADGAARVLAGVPDSRLLVHSGASADGGDAGLPKACATLLPAMQRHGIPSERLLISNEPMAGTAEVGALLACADLHLDTFPVSDDEGCRLAQSVGVTVLPDAGDVDAWVAVAIARTQGPKRPVPAAADPIALSDAMAAAFEAAHDLLVSGKLRNPKADLAMAPLVRPAAHAADYRALILSGKARRAERALRVLAEQGRAGAEVWRLLAVACLHQGHRQPAMAALQHSLRLEPRNPESWAVLEELAAAGGHAKLLEEVAAFRAALDGGAPAVAAAPATPRKSLYFSPVGRAGKDLLTQIVDRFPAEQFDFLVIAYDDTDFSDLESRGVRVIRERGQKWSLVKRHLTPEIVSNFEYVFIWDDDLDPAQFDALKFLDVVRRNQLDVAQPSLAPDGHNVHPITVAQARTYGRRTNFVEIMCPAYSSRIWPQIYPFIEPELNELGWGYDLLPQGRKGIVDCVSVRHTRPVRSQASGAIEQFLAWSRKHGVVRPAFANLGDLS